MSSSEETGFSEPDGALTGALGGVTGPAARFDANRVRIEFCDVMSFTGDGQVKSLQGAKIWLGDGQGSIRRSRKPHATLTADTRAGLLRQLAEWMEQRDDPGLTAMAAEVAERRKAGQA